MPKFFKKFLSLTIFCLLNLLLNMPIKINAMSSNSPLGIDPYPIYTSQDMHEFLYRKERQWLKDLSDSQEKETERVGFYISPFVQFADRGRDINNNQEYLGDINGRWNMIALLFGQTPDGLTLPPALQAAKDNLFGFGVTEVANPGTYVDSSKQFGFFAVPLQYKKYGARFEFDLRFCKDFGIAVQTGYACICQRQKDLCKKYDICSGVSCNANPCKNSITSANEIDEVMKDNLAGQDYPTTYGNQPSIRLKSETNRLNELESLKTTKTDACSATSENNCTHIGYTLPVDLTPCTTVTQLPTSNPSGAKTISANQVEYYLMNQLYTIANQMGLSLCDFERNSIEDVRFNLYWRHAIEANKGTDGSQWSHFLFIPFAELCYCAAVGDPKCETAMFSVPFGNNGHNAIGGKVGFLIDFTETMEIGIDGGATHFFDKSFSNYRVPTNIYQSGIFPFATNVKVCPGLNCFGTFKLAAHNFLGNLSTWWQYMIVSHKSDKICLCKPDAAFIPQVLEKRSCWTSQMLNIGFNYDISPNLALGLFCQAPLWQKRAYASCTVMGSLNMNF